MVKVKDFEKFSYIKINVGGVIDDIDKVIF